MIKRLTIGVIACSSEKLHPRDLGVKVLPAQVLYSKSNFFNLARAYVEKNSHHWVILSAKHHLVFPDTLLANYDQRLKRGGDKKWAAKVRKQIRSSFENGTRFLVVTGKDYQAHLFTPESGFDYYAPLQEIKVKGRLGIGHYRSFLSKELKGHE